MMQQIIFLWYENGQFIIAIVHPNAVSVHLFNTEGVLFKQFLIDLERSKTKPHEQKWKCDAMV